MLYNGRLMNPTDAENPFIFERMPQFMKVLITFLESQPIISALLILMFLDVLVGVCRAAITKTLSSTISWRGMSRKVIMLLLIGVAAVLEPFAGGLPLSKLVAMFYTVTEGLSILENAAASGVPLPRALVDALAKLRELGSQKQLPPAQSETAIHVNVPQGGHAEARVDAPKKP